MLKLLGNKPFEKVSKPELFHKRTFQKRLDKTRTLLEIIIFINS